MPKSKTPQIIPGRDMTISEWCFKRKPEPEREAFRYTLPAESFGWRDVPGGEEGQRFWHAWHLDKEAMKAAGFRVLRADDGHWIMMYEPPQVAS